MLSRLFSLFRGTRRYFFVTLLLLTAIILLGIFTPYLIDKKIASIPQERQSLKEDLQEKVGQRFSEIENEFTADFRDILPSVSALLQQEQISSFDLFNKLSEFYKPGFGIEIYDYRGEILAYSSNKIVIQNLNDLVSLPPGSVVFYTKAFSEYLLVSDTVRVGRSRLFVVYTALVESRLFDREELGFDLKNKFTFSAGVPPEIIFSPNAAESSSTDTLALPLRNGSGKDIGAVIYPLPTNIDFQDSFVDTIGFLQSLLLLGILLSILLAVRQDFGAIKSAAIKIVMVFFFAVVFRWIIFVLDIVSLIFPETLTNPNYFSSTFGDGIVKSPAEFLLTSLTLFFAVTFTGIFLSNRDSETTGSSKIYRYIYPLILLFYGAVTTLLFRGLAAVMRSVIFDSSLSYFKDSSLIPSLPGLIMNLGVFFVGGSFFVLVFSIGRLLQKSVPYEKLKKGIIRHFLIVVPVLLFTLILIFATSNPLVTPLLAVLFLLLVFFHFYISDYIYSGFAVQFIIGVIFASVISVALLNHFNSELTKEELKTAAHEFNRKNPGLIKFLMTDALENIPQSIEENLKNASSVPDFHAEAFYHWYQNPLSQELPSSGIYFLSADKKIIGGFGHKMEGVDILPPLLRYISITKAGIFSFTPEKSNKNIIHLVGITPLSKAFNQAAYLVVSVVYDAARINSKSDFPLFSNLTTAWRSTLETEDLNILNFRNKKLAFTRGDFYPDKNLIESLIDTSFLPTGEKWTNYTLSGEEYIFYSTINTATGEENITTAGIKIRTFAWNLFNFFKLFLIHTIFSIAIFTTVFILRIRKKDYPKYSFRSQLLLAFMVIAIIPIIALAVYNRVNIKEKAEEGIRNLLNQRSEMVLSYFTTHTKSSGVAAEQELFKKAETDLAVNFSVYDENRLIYSTQKQLISSGILPGVLDSETYYTLFHSGLRENYTNVHTGPAPSISQFRRFSIGGKDFVLETNSVLNKIKPIIQPIEIDILLFGVYALAIVVIIVLSSVMAERISSPLKKLTLATRSVAEGDFNYSMPANTRGELKELITGFENMTQELKRNQSEISSLEREAAWKEMARQVAHEIKNPLTPMKLTIQHLIHAYKTGAKNFDVVFDKVSSTIINQIEVLNQIASEFSRFARMPGINAEEIYPVEIIEDTLTLYREEQVTFIESYQAKETKILLDKSQFRRMMINLIRNSIQAGAKEIKISTTEELGMFSITISDNGKGVEEADREKIFHQGFTTKQGGMGLGLALIKRLLENAGGNISFFENDEYSANFIIQIPVVSQNNTIKG